ncbi:cell wall-binding repeat-containing protein [Romboutsia sp.]|uniref:cell wall-binding repeat-containing protein n=1 Tax=Romboutsia sp. TaxID=1965302 RepID=UPI003F2F8EDC
MKKISILLVVAILFVNLPLYKVEANENIQIKKIMGENIYETGTKISQEGWKSTANTVVLLNSKAIIDGIVASPLASIYDAPILLTNQDNLPTEMKKELLRLKPKNLIIIGGETMVSSQVINDIKTFLPSTAIERIGGENRYETSLMVAKKINEKQNIKEIYIGYGGSEADLLSIACKAGEKKQPIILTNKNFLENTTYEWLASKKIDNAYFIGGESVIQEEVITSINSISNNDVTKNRISGANRFETNAKVIEKFYYNKKLESPLITNSKAYETALMATPLASKLKSPMILVGDNGLDTTQEKVLSSKYTNTIYTIGSNINDSTINKIVNTLTYKEDTSDNGISKDILFFVPHQDDEIISFSNEIKKYIDKGYNVNVILMTDGSQSGVREILNGEGIVCNLHKYIHSPYKENYKCDNMSISYVNDLQFTKYRNDEFKRALLKLGLKEENIHFSRYKEPDKKLSKAMVTRGMMEFLEKYPNASVHTFYDKSYSKENHSDHVILGVVARELYSQGKIKNLCYHIEPYLYDKFLNSGLKENVLVEYAESKNAEQSIIEAMREYCIWEPQNGKMAIGYHSVSSIFDQAMKLPINYTIKFLQGF